MDVESSKSFFELGSVVLLFLTFAFGAGVVLTGNKVNKRQADRLRMFDSDLTTAKIELAKQQERAAEAEGSIALAEQHASEANTKAEGFRLDIAKSNEASARAQAEVAVATAEAAKATERAAEASKTAEQERIERLKLEAQVAPRRLTVQKQQDIAAHLVWLKGRTVTVASYALDSESAVLAGQIEASLQGAGFTVQDGIASRQPIGGFLLGVHVTGPDNQLVLALRTVLSNAGVEVAPANTEGPGRWEMRTWPTGQAAAEVVVGVKPLR